MIVYKVVRKLEDGMFSSLSVPESSPFFTHYYIGSRIERGWMGSWIFAYSDEKQAVEYLNEWEYGEPEDEECEILICEADMIGKVEFFACPGEVDDMIHMWNRMLRGDMRHFDDCFTCIYSGAIFVENLVPLSVSNWSDRYKVTENAGLFTVEEL